MTLLFLLVVDGVLLGVLACMRTCVRAWTVYRIAEEGAFRASDSGCGCVGIACSEAEGR